MTLEYCFVFKDKMLGNAKAFFFLPAEKKFPLNYRIQGQMLENSHVTIIINSSFILQIINDVKNSGSISNSVPQF